MATLQQYKCPRCGGDLNFDAGSQTVRCPYCDTEFAVASLLDYDQSLESMPADQLIDDLGSQNEWDEGETENMVVYVCKSCGGEIIADQTLGATKCPYCDSAVVIKEKFAGDMKPDYIIPFKLDKEAAKKGLENHMKGKKLLPRVFKDEKHIDEIKGVYVPVWLYDTDAVGHATFRGERVRTWSDRHFDYTETSYYALVRSGVLGFDNVPVDGSSKMDDTIMESLEPFDFREAVPFQTAYLAGYLADRYDSDAEQQIERANARIKRTMDSALESTVGPYSMITKERSTVQLYNTTSKYALYPVWLLSTTWKGKNYLFAMNGQTGKFVGDLPEDKGLTVRYFLGTFLAVTLAGLLFTLFRML